MNLENVLHEVEKVDAEVYDRLDNRRSAMKNFANMAGKIALAGLPIAFGSLFKKAYAGTKNVNDVLEILNYALKLEYLESEFYATALSKGVALIPATDTTQIQTISTHEAAHVNFLKSAITAAGGTPITKPVFDFSYGSGSGTGPFASAMTTNYDLFLAVSQTLEDTGVRAYKGRAAELVKGGDVLTAALKIHSVEARHASHIRLMRRKRGATAVKPWITGKDTGITGADVSNSYNGEENTKQATIEIMNINGMSISTNAATEAFDEPLTVAQVTTIITPFIKP